MALPVFFSITFKDSRFSGAAALQRMICHWSFPDGLQEYGWKVCHYFSGEKVPQSAGSGSAAAGGASPGTPDLTGYEIEVAGERHAAIASLRPLYDPKNERIKC